MKSIRRGFLLLEIICSLVILSGLAIIGTEILTSSLRLTHEAVAAEEASDQMRSALGMLRSDVWNASALASKENGQLLITWPQGDAIVWSTSSGDMVREQGGQQRRWAGIGTDTEFQVAGPSVVLLSKRGGHVDQLCLISQLEMAKQENR